ncbi:MAG: aminotransferase class I/II-fold pyridoxal phosphate-dependent enzyme [Mycobacterium sp.]
MSHHTSNDDGLSAILAAVGEPSSRALATAVESLIRDGVLPAGQRLATVRRVAEALNVSPATVSVAWTELRRAGWLHTDRRRGTVVALTFVDDVRPWSQYPLDEYLPDPQLLPPLEAAFAAAAAGRRADHDTDAVEPALLDAVTATWPYAPAAFTVANGGYEGTLLALRATVRPGGAVAVEQPTAPRILDTLRAVRAVAIPVQGDAEGPLPDALQEALFRRPDVFLYQPRSQVPSGTTVSHRRIEELASVLERAPSPVTVIEDDNIGPASSLPARSLGGVHPDRHVLIRSYCKAFGVDIRTCVISGPAEVVSRIDRIRTLGMLATSRLLQGALAHLLADEVTGRHLLIARRRHRDRRRALAAALRQHGLDVPGDGDGLALWVPVDDESHAHEQLSRLEVTVGSGAACRIQAPHASHVWVGTGSLPDEPMRISELAALLADAAAVPETGITTVG